MTELENHPIENGFIKDNIEILIVGTFPPKKEYNNNRNFFFYSSVRNHFWNRMENIFPLIKLKKTNNRCANVSPEQNVIDKQNFLESKKIGLIDIFTKIRRIKESSKDEDIISIENIIDNNKFDEIIRTKKDLKKVCCTYKLAFDTFKCKLDFKKISFKECQISANSQKIIYTQDNKREIEIYLLFPATRSREKGDVKDEQYKKLLFT